MTTPHAAKAPQTKIIVPSTAILLIGGLGTRLRPLTLHTPKALLPIKGIPVTEHLILLLKKYGVTHVILSVGYLKEKIKEYFSDGKKLGIAISYVPEDTPLGTAGPLLLARQNLTATFIASNGDELKDIDIQKMYEFHKSSGGVATLALTQVDDPSAYGVARMDGNKIVEFVEKPLRHEAPSNLINAGFYMLEPAILNLITAGHCMLEKSVFPVLAKQGQLYGFQFDGQWFDVGTPERYAIADQMWNGL